MSEQEANDRAHLYHYLEMSKRTYRMMLYELVKVRARQFIKHELPETEMSTIKQ